MCLPTLDQKQRRRRREAEEDREHRRKYSILHHSRTSPTLPDVSSDMKHELAAQPLIRAIMCFSNDSTLLLLLFLLHIHLIPAANRRASPLPSCLICNPHIPPGSIHPPSIPVSQTVRQTVHAAVSTEAHSFTWVTTEEVNQLVFTITYKKPRMF